MIKLGVRGFLSNYPNDVVWVVNGNAVTKADILQAKRERQARELAAKRNKYEPTTEPCFVWVFWTEGLIPSGFFRGWYLYIHSLRSSRKISIERNEELALKAMRLFPCGHLPIVENFERWKVAFAAAYHRPTSKRPSKQGLAVARVVYSPTGIIIDIHGGGE